MYAAGLLGQALGRNAKEVLILVAALGTVGNMLFFFRYIEAYALVTAIGLLVILTCCRYLRGYLPFGVPVGLAILAGLTHGQGFWYVPMVGMALFVRTLHAEKQARSRLVASHLLQGVCAIAVIIVLTVAIISLEGYTALRASTIMKTGFGALGGPDKAWFVPLLEAKASGEYFTFLSPPHIGAIIQEQLLTAPMAVPTLLILIIANRFLRSLARRLPELVVIATGAMSMFIFSISWNPDLGPRADWDLLAASAVPVTLLAMLLLTRLPDGRPKRLALVSYLSVSGVHTAAWVLLHIVGIRY